MSSIINRIKGRFSAPKYVFGRWSNDEKFKKKQLKIDYANEDHCFCDEYLKKKLKEHNDKTRTMKAPPSTNKIVASIYFPNEGSFMLWEMDNLIYCEEK